MNMEVIKQRIYDIMSEQDLCVVSTVNQGGQPQSALMGYSQNANLELMIGTRIGKRQYANLQQNNKVSVVIYDGSETTVQYEGIARGIIDKSELIIRQKAHFAKLPGAEKYSGKEDQVYLSIRPTWVRLTVHDGSEQEELYFE